MRGNIEVDYLIQTRKNKTIFKIEDYEHDQQQKTKSTQRA